MTAWDRLAKRFDTPAPGDEDEAVRRAKAYLKPSSEVLEIGCATGATAEALRPLVASWHGVDVSQEMIRRAKVRDVDATFQQGFVQDVAGSYDVIICFNVLHFLSLPSDLDHLRRRLRPGGLLLAQTPCLGDASRKVRWALPLVGLLLGLAPRRLRFAWLHDQISQRLDVLEADGSRPMQTWLVASNPSTAPAVA